MDVFRSVSTEFTWRDYRSMSWQPEKIREWLDAAIWREPDEPQSKGRMWTVRLMRLAIVLARDLASGQITLRAMGLVYTTLLAIVPLLALSFSVLKAFGVYNQIRPMLLGFLEPLGEQSVEITARTIEFIENVNVGVLGSVGLALLFYTAVSLVHKIEEALNFIWHISRARGIGERFSRYLSALLVGPVLVFSAIGITATATRLSVIRDAMEVEAIGWAVGQAGQLTPYLLVIAAFTFIYVFIPNTRVRFGPALAGGVVGGILWQSAGWAFATFVASSTNYAAIYSGFAILILFMLWLYLSWLILLFGASVSFYVQHQEYLEARGGELRLSSRMRERLALMIMGLIARRHREGLLPWTVDALSQTLRMPIRMVDACLSELQAHGFLAPTADEPTGWLPVRDPARVSAKDILDAVRITGEDRYLNPEVLPAPEAIESMIRRCDEATTAACGDVSVEKLGGD